MPITAAQLAEVRSWVSASWEPVEMFNDAAVGATFDRAGTVAAAALELTRRYRAELLAAPDTFSVSGEYSQGRANQLAALRVQIGQLEQRVAAEVAAAAGTVGVLGVGTSRLLDRVGGYGR